MRISHVVLNGWLVGEECWREEKLLLGRRNTSLRSAGQPSGGPYAGIYVN